MAPPPPRAEAAGTATGRGVFAVAAGCFLGIALLKLGNPVLLDAGTMYPPPAGLGEVISEPWPMSWGYVMLAVLAVAGLFVVRKPAANPAWMLWMPALWLGWQLLASARTIDPPLTRLTIAHFVASTACFYLGLCSAGGAGSGLRRVRPGLVAGLLVVLAAGIHQHHGGFQSNRRFFEENEMSGWTNVPPAEVRQLEMTRMLVRKPDGSLTVNPAVEHKLASGRIFGTLVYPNALAGVILLLLPLALVSTRDWTRRLGNVPHGALVGSVAYVGIACLYWSGSKSGWLVALALGVLTLLRLPLAKTLKVGLATLLIISGAAGLAIKYRDYFSRGRPAQPPGWIIGPLLGRTPRSIRCSAPGREPFSPSTRLPRSPSPRWRDSLTTTTSSRRVTRDGRDASPTAFSSEAPSCCSPGAPHGMT